MQPSANISASIVHTMHRLAILRGVIAFLYYWSCMLVQGVGWYFIITANTEGAPRLTCATFAIVGAIVCIHSAYVALQANNSVSSRTRKSSFNIDAKCDDSKGFRYCFFFGIALLPHAVLSTLSLMMPYSALWLPPEPPKGHK